VGHQSHADPAAGDALAAADVQVVDLGVVVVGPAVLQRVEQGLQCVIDVPPPVVRRVHVDGDRQASGDRPHAPGGECRLDGPAEGTAAAAQQRAVADPPPQVVDRRREREFKFHVVSLSVM
jgi:hypothetical protein